MGPQPPQTHVQSQTADDFHFRVRTEQYRESTHVESATVDIGHWRAAPFDADACPECGYDRIRKETHPDSESEATWTCPACGLSPDPDADPDADSRR